MDTAYALLSFIHLALICLVLAVIIATPKPSLLLIGWLTIVIGVDLAIAIVNFFVASAVDPNGAVPIVVLGHVVLTVALLAACYRVRTRRLADAQAEADRILRDWDRRNGNGSDH